MSNPAKILPSARPIFRADAGVLRVLSRLAGAARFFVDAVCVHKKALLTSVLCLLSSLAWSATPPNTAISNTARADYTIGASSLTTTSTATVNTAFCNTVGIKVDLMQYIPPARAAQAPVGAVTLQVDPSKYSPSGSTAGPFVALPAPAPSGSLLISPLHDIPGNRIFSYSRNEPIFLRVVSYDANTNPAAADTVSVTLTTGGGDSEVVQLTETGLSTGIFTGAIPSVFAAIGTPPTANDGKITVSAHNETISATYNHSSCTVAPNIAITSSGLIDPYGIVFDSLTGAPVNGATVSIVDSVTLVPATVFCDDGLTVLPQPVTTGSPTICDAAIAAGGYHLPLVAAGSYKLVVTPPGGYAFPSSIPAASLPATIGAPPVVPAIMGNPGLPPGASYGGVFALWGPALRIDIPADSGASDMAIQKTAGKSVAGTGEFVPYTLTIKNNRALAPLPGAQIADHTPPGFRYQKGSARLNGATMPDPTISSDARTLTFTLNIAAASTAIVRYVLEVTPGARTGTAENTAAATGGLTSNTAHASVVVREDLYRNKTMLIGRVIKGECSDNVDNNAKGLANARIVLQGGAYVLTDTDGKWHIDNLRPGTHVVQLDLDSLPKDYEVVGCEKNTRFAGRTYSQFVNLKGGTLWRADFHVRKKTPEALRLTQTLSATQGGGKANISLDLTSSAEVTGYSATLMLPESARYVPGSAKLNGAAIANPDIAGNALIFSGQARPGRWKDHYSVAIEGAARNAEIKSMVRFTQPGRAAQTLPVAQIALASNTMNIAENFANIDIDASKTELENTLKKFDPTHLVEVLPYNAAWLATAQPGTEWLHPQETFLPAIPAIKVAVKHLPGQSLKLKLNGEEVSALYSESAETNAARTVSLATWSGIHIKDGDNKLELLVTDASGKEVLRQTRNIHYTVSPDRAEFVPEQSRLVADGKTRPVIAVRFLDKEGYKMRPGINGEFLLNEPYRSHDRSDGLDRDPLSGRAGGKPRYEIQSDGVALIELDPTTQSGEAILNFQFNDKRTQEVRAWLEAGKRDWILVGFAEGTLGHKTLSGNVQTLQEAETDKQLFDGNKLAFYAKGSIKGDYLLTLAYDTAKETGNKQLKGMVDPTQYYTLYADASQAGFDGASASRLYVKLERKQFYAMFGDYDTGLTVTELSRYSRTLNGVKSEYKGDKAGYSAFATITAQAYVKDEIPGNGTSGVYRLSRGNLMVNSDRIRIDTRDRFQSQIIVTTRSMTRYLDYDIDYDKGTLTFREPIAVRDSNFNPTYIIAEYESADPADKKATFGGRASIKPTPKLEIGATGVKEGTVGATGDLEGLDVTYQPSEKTKLRAEIASTERNNAGVASGGSAWLGEVTHHEDKWDAKAYVREQDGGFGLGQQAASEIDTRKMGADARLKLSDTLQLQGQTYKQETLGTGAQHILVEGRADKRIGDNLNTYVGARTAQDKSAAGNTQSNQYLGGVAYAVPGKNLNLRAAVEISDTTAGSVNAPDRLTLGADYQVTQQTKIFTEHEIARGEKFSSNTTRAGLRTQPWSGGELSASLGNSRSSDAQRMYGNLGMVQRWQITEKWQTDFSLDRSQTLRNTATSLNVNTPLPSVSPTGDYTAGALGAAYHDTVWSGNGRVEMRFAGNDQQRNLQLGIQRSLENGRTLAAGFSMRNASGAGTTTNGSDLRLSYAHRPNDSKWVWFDRADYITQSNQSASSSLKGIKLVNNLNANYMFSRRTQIALQYGAKYVLETIDGSDYKGYTDLIGAEIRHDLNHKWDIGAFASMMRSLNSGVRDFGLGASIGYNVMDNMWLSAGYNLRGMNDRDFANASYRAQGPYITLRMKIDQDTLGLNKRDKSNRPMATK